MSTSLRAEEGFQLLHLFHTPDVERHPLVNLQYGITTMSGTEVNADRVENGGLSGWEGASEREREREECERDLCTCSG